MNELQELALNEGENTLRNKIVNFNKLIKFHCDSRRV